MEIEHRMTHIHDADKKYDLHHFGLKTQNGNVTFTHLHPLRGHFQ